MTFVLLQKEFQILSFVRASGSLLIYCSYKLRNYCSLLLMISQGASLTTGIKKIYSSHFFLQGRKNQYFAFSPTRNYKPFYFPAKTTFSESLNSIFQLLYETRSSILMIRNQLDNSLKVWRNIGFRCLSYSRT